MAYRQTGIAGENPALRMNICKKEIADGTVCPGDMGTDCSLCNTDDWALGGDCCGSVTASSVAQGGIYLAFSVRMHCISVRR